MIHVDFSQEAIDVLEYERYQHPSPQIQKRMEVLYLKSQGLTHMQICKICKISKTTMAKYLRLYKDEGVEGLKRLDYKGKPNEMLKNRDTIESHLQKYPPRTTTEAQELIEKLTGIRRSPTQIRVFMKRIGMK